MRRFLVAKASVLVTRFFRKEELMAKQTSTRSSSAPPKRKVSSAPPAPTTDIAVAPAMPRDAPTHEQIAARALEIYRARGSADGNELSDWLRAESELRAP
jgi:hypothetical protein